MRTKKQILENMIKNIIIEELQISEMLDTRRPPKELASYIRTALNKQRLMTLGRSIYQKTGYSKLKDDSRFLDLVRKYNGVFRNNQFDTSDGFEIYIE